MTKTRKLSQPTVRPFSRLSARGYRPEQFVDWLEPLLVSNGMSARQASLMAKLDPSAISRYQRGSRPAVKACIAIGALFSQENEALRAAQYEVQRTEKLEQGHMDSDVVHLAKKIDKRLKSFDKAEDRQRWLRLVHNVVDMAN